MDPMPEMQQIKLTNFFRTFFDQYMNKKSIFLNRKVLTDAYVPETILHREEQIKQLTAILAPALKFDKPSNVFMYGKTGTGKTLVAKYVSMQLVLTAQKYKAPLKVIYVNCKMRKVSDTEYRVIANLLKEFGDSVPSTGLPLDELYSRLFSVIDSSPQVVILILDEIDHLVKKAGDEVLYNLTRINSELKNSLISFVGISNSLTFMDELDPRVKSSLSEEEILFPPYNAKQLIDILKQRASLAFRPGAIGEGVIEKIAAIAAREHGDARRALELLRVSGEIADREGEEVIKLHHVDKALQKIETDKVTEIVRSLPRHSQILLYTILSMKKQGMDILYTGQLYDKYREKCLELGTTPLTQRRISDIISELDMLGVVTSRVISKGRYGRTREISLALPDYVSVKVENLLQDLLGLRYDGQ